MIRCEDCQNFGECGDVEKEECLSNDNCYFEQREEDEEE